MVIKGFIQDGTLGRECNLCVVISSIQQNQSSTYGVGLIILGWC